LSTILHPVYWVGDLECSLAFYRALGMELRREEPIVRDGRLAETCYFVGFTGQDAEIELDVAHDGRSFDPGGAYDHLTVGVDDLDETLAALADAGCEPAWGPHRPREDGPRLCWVIDPDGFRVELIEQGGK
jgi:lactoylglutathione lyase